MINPSWKQSNRLLRNFSQPSCRPQSGQLFEVGLKRMEQAGQITVSASKLNIASSPGISSLLRPVDLI